MPKKILVVGDLHGDWGRLNTLITKKNPDIILQCGDFGWWPGLEVKKPVLYGLQKPWSHKGVKPRDTKVYWCDGNHEDHDELMLYPPEHPIELYKNVFYCPRGSRVALPDGRVVLFVGGADSVDKDLRIQGRNWFPQELINQENLDRCNTGAKAHIVISHTAPRSFIAAMDEMISSKINDPSTEALNRVLDFHQPALWYFGHWHREVKGVLCRVAHNSTTKFYGLDYPGHGGRWWRELEGR